MAKCRPKVRYTSLWKNIIYSTFKNCPYIQSNGTDTLKKRKYRNSHCITYNTCFNCRLEEYNEMKFRYLFQCNNVYLEDKKWKKFPWYDISWQGRKLYMDSDAQINRAEISSKHNLRTYSMLLFYILRCKIKVRTGLVSSIGPFRRD